MTLEFKDPKACPCQSKHRRMAHVTNRTDGSTDVAITCVVCGDTVILGVEPEEPDVGGVAVSENQSSTPCLVFESRRHIPDDLFDVLLRMGAEEVYAGARGINEDILKRIVDHVDSSEVSLSYTSASEVGHGAGGQGMSTEKKRERLREEMANCPACIPEDADSVDEEELDNWLSTHGVDPREVG